MALHALLNPSRGPQRGTQESKSITFLHPKGSCSSPAVTGPVLPPAALLQWRMTHSLLAPTGEGCHTVPGRGHKPPRSS